MKNTKDEDTKRKATLAACIISGLAIIAAFMSGTAIASEAGSAQQQQPFYTNVEMITLKDPIPMAANVPAYEEHGTIEYGADPVGPIAATGAIEVSDEIVQAYEMQKEEAEQKAREEAEQKEQEEAVQKSQEEQVEQNKAAATAAPAVAKVQQPAPHYEPNTITVEGVTIPYIWDLKAATAPTHGAAVWMGNDDTTDGSWGYFIGHHPGDFGPVMNLRNGDAVTVCDGNGNTRTYHVIDVFDVPDTTTWNQIADRVTSHGESAVLQTCVGDNAHYRIVVAD